MVSTITLNWSCANANQPAGVVRHNFTRSAGRSPTMREFCLGEAVRHEPTGTVATITLIDERFDGTMYHLVIARDPFDYELRTCRGEEIARVVERRLRPRRAG